MSSPPKCKSSKLSTWKQMSSETFAFGAKRGEILRQKCRINTPSDYAHTHKIVCKASTYINLILTLIFFLELGKKNYVTSVLWLKLLIAGPSPRSNKNNWLFYWNFSVFFGDFGMVFMFVLGKQVLGSSWGKFSNTHPSLLVLAQRRMNFTLSICYRFSWIQ